MQRFFVAALCVTAFAIPPALGATAPVADLRITVWPSGRQGPSVAWTLRCAPLGGSLPDKARACRTIVNKSRPFRTVPQNLICAQVYGGPQVADVRGRFRGRRVAASFDRRDACEIDRWNRLRLLFPSRR